MWTRGFMIFFLISFVFSLEVGKVEIRDQDILIPVKGAEFISLELLNPLKLKKVGPNFDWRGYKHVYKYAYLSLCYGDIYYRDKGKNVYGTLKKWGNKWVVDTSSLPSQGNFKLLPVRLCVCFSDDELKSIDFWNEGLDNVCSTNIPVWINYTNKEAFKELGLSGKNLRLNVRIKSEEGVYKDVKIELSE